MVMKALRDTASAGIGKFILFGFLVLAVAGLALMDIGGFFTGEASSNDVMKYKGETVSIIQFDRDVQRQLRPLGLSAQEAYKTGYLDQILGGKIRQILMNEQADKAGLYVGQERVASHIAALLQPLAEENGQQPQDILQQILRTQGLTEKQFAAAITDEMLSSLIAETVASGALKSNEDLVYALNEFQNETRTLSYLKFLDKDIKVDAPSDDVLQGLYEGNKARYIVPETRDITIIAIDDSDIINNTDLSASDMIEDKLSRAEQLEDLTQSGASLDDIKATMQVKIFTVSALSKTGTYDKTSLPDYISGDLNPIVEESFALEEGQTSMALELSGAKFLTVTVDAITEENYKSFEAVKDDLIQIWQSAEQRKTNQDNVSNIAASLNDEATSLKAYADEQSRRHRTIEELKRRPAQAPLNNALTREIFAAPLNGDAKIGRIDGGYIIYRVTDSSLLNEQKSDPAALAAMQDSLTSELADSTLNHILESEHNKAPASVNRKLLDRIYGENSEYY